MKRKRYVKLCSLVICFVLLFNVMSYSTSAKYFSDTYVGMLDREFFDAMNYVTDNGWMNGTDTTHFSPYVGITRGMFVTILYRYSGDTGQYTSNFTDVPSSVYYYNPISWANYHNIVNGITETTFEPETIITKEQMAVILYRYAKNIEGKTYTVSTFSSISAHPDYSSVSPYAMEAVRWAKTYHVFPLADNNSYISPLAQMNRAYTALYITNYSREVTGFIARDRFSFPHNTSSFHSTYILSYNAQQHLFSCIDAYYGSNNSDTASEVKRAIRAEVGTTFKGSCFGMIITMLYDKIGKIDFNTNCANNASSMSTVGIPHYNSATVESAINYYQEVHYVTGFNYLVYDDSLLSGIEAIREYVANHGVTPIAYYWADYDDNTSPGHAILVTDITRSASNMEYYLTVLDPNKLQSGALQYTVFSDGVFLFIRETGSYGTTTTKQLTKLYCYTKESCDFLDHFDIDGAHNNQNIFTESTTSNNDSVSTETSTYSSTNNVINHLTGTVRIRVPFSQFTITSGSGDTLYCNGTSLSGSMKVLESTMVPNGPDLPCTLLITVKASDIFEFENISSEYSYFSVSSPNGFGCVSGEGLDKVTMNFETNTLTTEGSDQLFSAWLETGFSGYEFFYIEGSSETEFSVAANNETVEITGLVGTQKCGFSDANSLIADTSLLQFTGNNVLDMTEIADSDCLQFANNP